MHKFYVIDAPSPFIAGYNISAIKSSSAVPEATGVDEVVAEWGQRRLCRYHAAAGHNSRCRSATEQKHPGGRRGGP